MTDLKNTEAMVQDQNLTPAPQAGAEQKETSESMESTEQIAPVATLGQQLAGEEATKVPTPETPADAPATAETDTPESTEEKVDGTTEFISLEPVTLEKYRIYSSSELAAMGVRFARLIDNRDINEGAVKKKMESIKAADGVISSSLLVPARTCLEQGHRVEMDGEEITLETPGLDNIYVLVDGQHRKEAVQRLNNYPAKDDAGDTKKYEDYFNIPLIDKYNVSCLLRETNTATFPWKDRQYLSNLLMLKPEKKLELLNELQEHPQATTKAALHWLTLDTSRTLYSRNIVAAMLDDKVLTEINDVDTDRLSAGKKAFSAAEDAFGATLAGTTPFSDWAVETIINNPKVPAVDMANTLAAFFKWLKEQGKATTYMSIKGQKATATQSFIAKDTVIRQQLGTDYKDYLATLDK